MSHKLSRRKFLKGSSIATGAGMALSGAAPSFARPSLNDIRACTNGSDFTTPLKIHKQKKALVFIMLDGGNDSYNMLVPTSGREYADYKSSRSNLALNKDQLLPLGGYQDNKGQNFGVHYSMPEVQQLFNDKKLSFMANIGPMIEPVSKTSFQNGSAKIPLGLLSHADQFKHWQTSRPHQRVNQGWFGYFSDSLQQNRKLAQIPMNISLAGNNIMQNGVDSSQYSITQKGSVGLVVNDERNALNTELLTSFERLLNTHYASDPFKQTYLSQTREAQAQHENYRKATQDVRLPNDYSDSDLSQQLKKVAQSIKVSDALGTSQQTFFLRYIGWDHHDELLNNQAKMLRVVSKALGEFQASLDELDLADKVVTFTGSDFGRTLTSNGNGTDHGWGGNTMVMGSPVNGGEIFGDYPSLTLGRDNPLDTGDGVLIPTTSTDQLYAELSLWFGVDKSELHRLFPNLANFKAGANCDFKAMGILRS